MFTSIPNAVSLWVLVGLIVFLPLWGVLLTGVFKVVGNVIVFFLERGSKRKDS